MILLGAILRHGLRRHTAIAFATLNILFGAWVTCIPQIKARLELSDGALGLALFFVPMGALLISPFSSWFIKNLGSGLLTALSVWLLPVIYALPVVAPSYWWLAGALLLTGVIAALLDIAMNAAASELEQAAARNLMSTFHGFFSLGGIIGAAGAGALLQAGYSPLQVMLAAGVLSWLINSPVWGLRKLPKQVHEHPDFMIPPRAVLGLVLVGFMAMLAEGAIADWSAVYLRDTLHATELLAGVAYATFSVTMAIGRFTGDGLTDRYSGRPMVIAGLLLSLLGLVAVQVQQPVTAIIGFGIAGLGFSVVVPVLYSLSGKLPGVPSAVGVASIASSGYIGMLVGPVVIGMAAEYLGLRAGLLVLVLLVGLAVILAVRVLPGKQH